MIDLDGPVHVVARRLLGAKVISSVNGQTVALILNEVEAYGGHDDPASHAYRGLTQRNRSMFDGAGTLYVYRSYGIHWCANVVTGQTGIGEAVLLRGGLPLSGLDVMVERRGRPDHLADGPGKLCQALGISGTHDGSSVLGGGPIMIESPTRPPESIEAMPRVGISRATDRLWRYTAVI